MRASVSLTLLSAANALLMESLRHTPGGWELIGFPRPELELQLRIAMTPPQQGLFEQTLSDISNPDHSRYGQYLKRDELKTLLRPSSAATEEVFQWLTSAGVNSSNIIEDGEWITFIAPVKVANDVLETSFGIYQNTRGQRRLRTLQYSLPSSLHKYVFSDRSCAFI